MEKQQSKRNKNEIKKIRKINKVKICCLFKNILT
jgi:hypothetical protein